MQIFQGRNLPLLLFYPPQDDGKCRSPITVVHPTDLNTILFIDGYRSAQPRGVWLCCGNVNCSQASSSAETNLLTEGFLGTSAPRYADLVLLLEVGMGLALLAGAVIARRKRFRLHAWCQSSVVLLNSAIVILLMVPSYHAYVIPKIPAKLGKAYYALATVHAVLGSVTEIAGLYILLAAGTNIVPRRFRMTKYKLWMRSVLALWWLVLLLGLATYVRWYVPGVFRKRICGV